MIRKLLATSAIAAVVATGAYAQSTTTQTAPADTTAPAQTTEQAAPAPITPADGFLASNLIGENVYNGTGDNAENIGDVNDLIVDGKGMIKSVIIGVGGFLGVGEKNVEMGYDKIKWAEKNGDRWIVVAATKDELKGLPTFDRRPYEPAPAPMSTSSTTGTGMAPADTTQPAAPATGTGNTGTTAD